MKRTFLFLLVALLPLLALPQGIITRPTKKPTQTTTPAQKPPKKRNVINGHEYVDLGLSVKWATTNVGASSPSDYGYYFAWGETSTKSEYTDANSRTYKTSMGDIAGNAAYDAARANWGGTWRLPTEAEYEELVKQCTWTWTTQGGHNGYRVTGKNGNSIFLPAAGYCIVCSPLGVGEYGYYWSSTTGGSSTVYACSLFFYSSYHDVGSIYHRCNGHSVRPVSE
ncbi:MAG: hypothetical protein ACI36X_07515 [Bacteroidaceae bacterium]